MLVELILVTGLEWIEAAARVVAALPAGVLVDRTDVVVYSPTSNGEPVHDYVLSMS